MIMPLARKRLIAPWRLVTTGEAPHGVVLRPAIPAESDGNRLSSEIERGSTTCCRPALPIRGGGDPREAWLQRRPGEWACRPGAGRVILWSGASTTP
jgi:hypothetical protein